MKLTNMWEVSILENDLTQKNFGCLLSEISESLKPFFVSTFTDKYRRILQSAFHTDGSPPPGAH